MAYDTRNERTYLLTQDFRNHVLRHAFFTEDGSVLVIFGPNHCELRPWEAVAPIKALIEAAAMRASGRLTTDEQQKYLHE